MNFDVKLTIYEGNGQVRDIPVTSRRLSIGRGTDNDLPIDDQGLSRRHLLLDIFDDAVQLTDCGSQNGTMVNRQPLVGSTMLKDGDSILIGYACDIRVQIRRLANANNGGPRKVYSGGPTNFSTGSSGSSTSPNTGSNNVLIIALGSIIGIFIVAGLLVILLHNGEGSPNKNTQKNIDIVVPPIEPKGNDNPKIDGQENNNQDPTINDTTRPPANKSVDELGAKVLGRLTKDKQKYIFSEPALRDINQMIERLKGSGNTASAIASIRQRKSRIAETAKRLGLESGFGVYAVLAESESRGPDAEAAILNDLAFVSTTIGAGTAENALVSLAAYKEGRGTVKSHPLIVRIRGKVDPQTQRNVWYLHEHKFISDEQYNFVLKFIALGIIAENPRFFGINTEPLAF